MSPLVSMALRNVLRNRRRTLITLAALTVGVTAVGTIRGILNGLQDTIIKSSIEAQLGALQVHRTGYLANVLSTPLTLDFPFDDALVTESRVPPTPVMVTGSGVPPLLGQVPVPAT